MPRTFATAVFLVLTLGIPTVRAKPDEMPWVAVSKDKKGFILDPSGRPFVPWGLNYDHDDKGRLLEDYWDEEWPAVEANPLPPSLGHSARADVPPYPCRPPRAIIAGQPPTSERPGDEGC